MHNGTAGADGTARGLVQGSRVAEGPHVPARVPDCLGNVPVDGATLTEYQVINIRNGQKERGRLRRRENRALNTQEDRGFERKGCFQGQGREEEDRKDCITFAHRRAMGTCQKTVGGTEDRKVNGMWGRRGR